MKRKDFIKTSSLALLSLPLLAIVNACSNNDVAPNTGMTPGDKNCIDNGTTVNIGSNHGHTLTVSKDDVQSGIEKTYAIQGGSSHGHDVIITASMFNSLKSNTNIDVSSTSGSGHTHSITVSCA